MTRAAQRHGLETALTLCGKRSICGFGGFDWSPNASGFMYYSGVPAAPIALGSRCTVEVDLATFSTLLPVVANVTGAWSVTPGPVDPSLAVGLQVALQIALFSTPGALGFDVSNGLIVTVGY